MEGAFKTWLIILLFTCTGIPSSKGYIVFEKSEYIVEEKQSNNIVQLILKHNESLQERLFFTCDLSSNASGDFISTTEAGAFNPGESSSTCEFHVIDDDIPEGNETFPVSVLIRNNNTLLSNMTYITILLNDDPHGFIGFTQPGQSVTVEEPADKGIDTIIFNMTRYGGSIGDVGIVWEITQRFNPSSPDIQPYKGIVNFTNGQSSQMLHIIVLPDKIPESIEIFTIRMVSAFGGAKVLLNSSEVEIRIQENDAPLRFRHNEVTFTEPETKAIHVYRGLDINEKRIGPISDEARVSYETVDGTAIAGKDYVFQKGEIIFPSGITKKTIDIRVLKDPIPELHEVFTIRLTNPSFNVILSNPHELRVIIAQNGDPYGVVSFNESHVVNQTIVLDEDENILTASVPIIRNSGTYGNISVTWRLEDPSGGSFLPFVESSNHAIFLEGKSSTYINISIKPDDMPNIPTLFILSLSNISGGGRLKMDDVGQLPKMRVFVKDSDNAYGIIQFSDEKTKLILSTTPRRFDIKIQRTDGAIGHVDVYYKIRYFYNGRSGAVSSPLYSDSGVVAFDDKQREERIAGEIRNDVFLKTDSYFVITLERVALKEKTLTPTSSPILGTLKTIYLNITSDLANAEYGFFNAPIIRTGTEPENTTDRHVVVLHLMRDGTSVTATVFWRIKSNHKLFTNSDASPMYGNVTFHKGVNNASITIAVLPDDIPELDEKFIIELVNVTGQNERLRPGATTATITIKENDRPDGTFQFQSSLRVLLNESSSQTMDIVRLGGSLRSQSVRVEILNGKEDFKPYFSVITFPAGVTSKPMFLYPIDDSIPEIDETFIVKLSSTSGAALGNITSFNVTILANDEPYGVISFAQSSTNLNQRISELRGQEATVSFQISRKKGLFNEVAIFWDISSANTSLNVSKQIRPTFGYVTIDADLNSATIMLYILQDEFPEGDQVFILNIVNVTGGATLAQPSQAKVKILANDFPVTVSPWNNAAHEGENVTLIVQLPVVLPNDVRVTFETKPNTASKNDFSQIQTDIVISAGTKSTFMNIHIVEDDTPELEECFEVIGTHTTGNTVLHQNYSSKICILPNDDAGGVFQFNKQQIDKVVEGSEVQVRVDRDRGTFGKALVNWRVEFLDGQLAASNEVSQPSGSISFDISQTSELLQFNISQDGTPELEEVFVLRLYSVSGAHVQLGTRTILNITVVGNDYPNGLFVIDQLSSDRIFAEDNMDRENTTGMVYVDREMGNFFAAKVLWMISPMRLGSKSFQLLDVLLHGHKNFTKEVKGIGERDISLQFSKGSFVKVSEEMQALKFGNKLIDGITLRFSLKTNIKDEMTVIDLQNVYGESQLTVTIYDNVLSVLIFTNRSLEIKNHSSLTSLCDDNWHDVIISVATIGRLDAFVDGEHALTHETLAPVIVLENGDVYIGASHKNRRGFVGIIRNVWIYGRSLDNSEIKDALNLSKRFNETSGYLTFEKNQSRRAIKIEIINDLIPQRRMNYVVRLADVGDDRNEIEEKAVISEHQGVLNITVIKSDFVNGIFGLSANDCSIVSSEAESVYLIEVERQHSFVGRVKLYWEILDGNGQLSTSQFVTANGSVEFNEYEKHKNISILPLDDSKPEKDESYIFKLVNAYAIEDEWESSNDSGASISQLNMYCNVTILSSDNPNGIFQVMSYVPNTAEYIPVRKKYGYHDVDEEIGTLDLFIVRAQGTDGKVSVEWKTLTNGTAINGKDFQENVGKVTMNEGERSAKISINIFDNSIPELMKTFSVILKNPSGGAIVNDISPIIIEIKPSDGALGVFSVEEEFLHVEEGKSVNITIHRDLGALDEVLVYWKLLNGSHDFVNGDGEVRFGKGVNEVVISILTREEEISEEAETFVLKLINATGGDVNLTKDTTNIIITPSDHPYGLFHFKSRTKTVVEGQQNVTVAIVRSKGTRGMVRLYYETTTEGTSSNAATSGIDFIHLNGTLDFRKHEFEKKILFNIVEDDIPESDETFLLNITAVELLEPVTNFPIKSMIGSPQRCFVTIAKNDHSNGLLEFEKSVVNVTEENVGAGLMVVRNRGTFGNISFSFRIESDSTATIGVDFAVSTFTVSMIDGQRNTSIPIYILHDDEPELTESLHVTLLSDSIQGGAHLDEITSCYVNILENDHPYGLIGIEHLIPVILNEPEGTAPLRVAIKLMREWGSRGVIKVQWKLSPNTRDFASTTGEVGFLSGETHATVYINVLPDNEPELNETSTFVLTDVTEGRARINEMKDRLSVVILGNDNPFGVVMFKDKNLTVDELQSTVNVSLHVIRLGGLFGDVNVFYRTIELDPSFNRNRATENVDFKEEFDSHITIQNGSSEGIIHVRIYPDDIGELDEHFQVAITKVELSKSSKSSSTLRHMIGPNNLVNITIKQNDHPNGLFRIFLDIPGHKSQLSILEPNEGNVPIRIYIDRLFGTFGTVSVSWRLAAGYTITPNMDITGKTSGDVTFAPAETRKSFVINVNSDNIPEDEEMFSLELFNKSGGAQIDPLHPIVLIKIRANDHAGGLIGFQPGSLAINVNEGETFSVFVQRTSPALGRAIVEWVLQGEANNTHDFVTSHGTVEFQVSQILAVIKLSVRLDDIPEINERFKLNLTSINSTGIDTSGAAVLDNSASIAYIVVGASNNPHGVLEFYNAQKSIRVSESQGEVNVRIVRQFGKLGQLQLFYDILPIPANNTLKPANLLDDVQVTKSYMVFQDGEDSVKISIVIKNDEQLEVDEGFYVKLTSVKLLSKNTTNMPPVLGSIDTLLVVIEANDGARGVLSFAQQSLNIHVDEKDSTLNLTVTRSRGTFGSVYCFYFLNRLNASKRDFRIDSVMDGGPAKLHFVDGQRSANITIYILDDNETEDLEQFEVGLTTQNAVGNGGVVVGQPSRTVVTIRANDNAHGIFIFSENSRLVTISEPSINNGLGTYLFSVDRLAGVFGEVTVSWQVLNATTFTDVTPLNGILTFDAFERQQKFQLTVVPDDVPELERRLFIQLGIVRGGGKLGFNSTASLIVPANDNPHGKFSFESSVVHVDEWKNLLQVSVVREDGLFGSAAVDFHTEDITAKSFPGNTSTFSVHNMYKVSKFKCSHSFQLGADIYLIIVSRDHSTFYLWRGVFVKIKDVSFMNTYLVKSIEANVTTRLLVAANTSHITVFQFHASNMALVRLETIHVFGITDILLTKLSDVIHLVVSVGVSETGETINKLKLFRWGNNKFVKVPPLYQTFHGKTIDIIRDDDGYSYLAVGNYYHSVTNRFQTQSFIYRWSNAQNLFKFYGIIETDAVLQLKFFSTESSLYIAVANEKSACSVYKHDRTVSGRFKIHQNFNTSCQSISLFEQRSKLYLVLVSNLTFLFSFDRQTERFNYELILPYKNITYYDVITISKTSYKTLSLMYQHPSTDFQLLHLSHINSGSDYINRNGKLIFDENQKKLSFYITIIKDAQPEDDETFLIKLSNATNGAVISQTKSSLEVVIMASDNAYGRIGFANSSRHKLITEGNHDIAFELVVFREFGTNRNVTVSYNVSKISGDETRNEIYPEVGHLTLPAGQNHKVLRLYLTGDVVPELKETFLVSLTGIRTQGLGAGGATLNYLQRTSVVEVLPNDHPYGVLGWQSTLVVTTEEVEKNASALLVMRRAEGAYGDVIVHYETVLAQHVGPRERAAKPNVDFIPTSGNVTLYEGQHEAYVFIGIVHKSMELKFINDKDASFNEIFFVNITRVQFLDKRIDSVVQPIINKDKQLVQIVITEVIQNNGVIEFNSSAVISVDEDIGILKVPVIRHHGLDGSVGIYFELIYKTRGMNSLDVHPRTGSASFAPNETTTAINVTIVDDDLPELMESFEIQLTKPVGGATIGQQRRADVRIQENDYPYGLFGIQSNVSQLFVEEGQLVTVVVQRRYGNHKTVEVTWSCNNSFSEDISMVAGRLLFMEGERTKQFNFFIINDDEPEAQEDFACFLDNVSSPGVLAFQRIINISISASDKPYGEYQINTNSRHLIVSEPTRTGENGTFRISVIRTGGQLDRSTVSWKISALQDELNNTVRTFSQTSGMFIFEPGNKEKTVEIGVIDDRIPEASQKYLFRLHSPTNGAELSQVLNSTISDVTVASSDHAYGVFSLVGGPSILVQESVGSFNVIIKREGGLIGDVEISYAVFGENNADVLPRVGNATFAKGNQISTLTFNVVDDTIPELDETFVIRLTAATLLHQRIDTRVDHPPSLKTNAISVNVTVKENDHPYGLIGFDREKVIYHEWQNKVKLPVVRNGGAFGEANVSFSYTPISATQFIDFDIAQSYILFNDGQNQSFIEVTLIDDNLPEQQESFIIDLHNINNGRVKLSNQSQLTFIIETSDNPSGLFGIFNISSTIQLQNPLVNKVLQFPISRLAGTSGEIKVTWAIVRTVSSSSLVSEDLSPSSGVVTFANGQSGSIVIKVMALPYGGPQEAEERFHFILKNVSGGGALDESSSSVLIVIKKKGYPNGLFYMSGVIEPSSIIDEPTNINETTLKIHVNRQFGRVGGVNVKWGVYSTSGDLSRDLRFNRTGFLIFPDGKVNSVIEIHVVNDETPELDEEFQVKLLTADLEGEIDENRDRISFTVRANDDPYGVFYLPVNEQMFRLNSSTLQRSLIVTVARDRGTFETCVASVIVTHTDLLPMRADVEVGPSQSQGSVELKIPQSSFLPSDTSVVVRIMSVMLKGSSIRPTLIAARSTQTIKIPKIMANSVVEIEASATNVMVNPISQMATVTITRSGLYGTITVPWSSGYPSNIIKNSSPGLISPTQGSVVINHGSRIGTFTFQAVLPHKIDRTFDYVVHLDAETQPSPNQNGWPRLGSNIYSVLEPHGVVQVASEGVTALEGSVADISIIRSYSTLGTIRVFYKTVLSAGNNPAIPGKDFVSITSYVDFMEGEFEKTISIEILDDAVDPKPEVDEQFSVELISVSVLSAKFHSSSPRLGDRILTNVTIQDNDNPFGTISFSSGSRAFNVDESSASVELTLERSGGTFSSSTVEVVTLGGGERWTKEITRNYDANSPLLLQLRDITNPASAESDYAPFRKKIIFPEQTWSSGTPMQQQKVKLQLYNDETAEPMESFIVVIVNATGGAIIFQPHSYAVVSIKPSGMYNGLVHFERTTAILNEDDSAEVQLVVLREGNLNEEIVITWASHSNGFQLKDQLMQTKGTINITAGSNKARISLYAVQDTKPELAAWFFVNLTSVSSGAVIKTSMSAVNVSMPESDYPSGRIAFGVSSRYPVVTLGENEVELVVRRFNGTMNNIQVGFSTQPMTGVIRDGGILMNPAIEGTDFIKTNGVLSFSDGQTKTYVKVRLLVDQSTTTTYPKIFNVTLQNPSSGAVLSPSYHSSRIIISNKETTGKFLKLRSNLLSVPLNDAKIVELLTSLLKDAQSEMTEDEHQLARTTIEAILDYKNTQTPGQKTVQAQAKDLLLNIFNELMSTSRSDTKGHSYWMKLLEKSLYAFTNDWICPTRNSFSRSNFDVIVERQNKSKLNGASYGSNGNVFSYPVSMYPDDEGASCTDVQFVDMKNNQWFSGSNSVLNNKVLSSSVRSGNVGGTKKVVFRILAPQNRITPTGVSCVIWDYPSSPSTVGSWSNKNCKIRSEEKKYVECECDHMSEYAVLAKSDDRTGYEIYFFVSCFVIIGACFLALISHHLCAIDKTFPSKLLMHTFFAVMLTNVIYVIAAYLSPRLISQPERCSVLGIFLHFAFLSQFSSILVQVSNLWKILILNDEHSYRKAVTFYIIGWGLPVLIIVGYFFITHAVWDWSLSMMYGDVHGNGDLCFIPHAYAAFSVAVIPVLLFMLAALVVFVQAYQITPQWKCYDDIYRGRYNIKEVRHLMILFSLVTLTWLFGGLHIAYGHLWMAIAFTFFNAFTGLDVFLVYVVLRNQMRYLFRGKYDLDQPVDEMDHVMYQPANDVAKNIEMREWDTIDVARATPASVEQKMRRSATPMSQRSPYQDRRELSTNFQRRTPGGNRTSMMDNSNGLMNESYNDDDDDEDHLNGVDDLIFALKSSGNFTPSIHEGFQNDADNYHDDEDDAEIFPNPPPSSERYSAVRRIKMSDTPL